MDEAAAIRCLLDGAIHDPFALLGCHPDGDGLVWRCFVPWAEDVVVIARGDAANRICHLNSKDGPGFFVGHACGKSVPDYQLLVRHAGGSSVIEDPYRFQPVLGELDVYLLAEGTHLQAYEKLGAHPQISDGVSGVGFAVWAPNASAVSVVGDFNDWDARRNPMRLHPSCGVWDLFVPGLAPHATYKFRIRGQAGEILPLKADPFALAAELPPRTASVVAAPSHYAWSDAPWMAARSRRQGPDSAISIYEVHLGSWRRRWSDGGFLSWRELTEELIPYVKDMGFSHIEVLPISEFPFDGSWGYQPIGLMAPTARFGDADGFRGFVDACHGAGIGIIVDFVPAHFPSDAHGLVRFDGTALYEHADPRQGFHQDWNTLIYNYGRREVANFLIAAALSWFERFHIDGLRVDAVASMLYLDYSRAEGAWIPNADGGRENWDAVRFIQRLNEAVLARFPGSLTIAEESTAWPGVTRPVGEGGLGFSGKWNMGWMHDTLRYFSRDPLYRGHHQNDLTFGLLYAFSETFILPLSHDEVVHGKGSLISKMPGEPAQAFANLRACYAFMWGHPGKKLVFMGGEFAQHREWNHDRALDWHLRDMPQHAGVSTLLRDLNAIYRSEPALHQLDASPDGFVWIDAEDSAGNVLSFLRRSRDPGPDILVVCNFSGVPRFGYRIGVPQAGHWAERINTDALEYGGSGLGNFSGGVTQPVACHGHPQSLELTLPPLSVLYFRSPSGR